MIEVEGLVRDLGDTRVLDQLTFTAPPGAVTAFLGPNGAGKTTTMRVLSTLLRPTEGTVQVAGYDVVTDSQAVRRSIGLVTEEASLFDRLTGREHLEFTARAHDLAPERITERIETVIELLRFGDHVDKRATTMSKGNRQKVALARALVHDPPVLLLDEPMANLDIVARSSIEELLTDPDIVAGKTVLLSTHSIDEAERLCHRVVAIAEGKTVAEGTQDEIVASTGSDSFRVAVLDLMTRSTLVL